MAKAGGQLLEAGGKVLGGVATVADGVQVLGGVNNIAQGNVATGTTDVISGGVSLGLDVAGGVALKTGVATGGTVALVGVAAGGSVALATETVHAAIEGRETPLEVADKFYGTHFSNIIGWIAGDYSGR